MMNRRSSLEFLFLITLWDVKEPTIITKSARHSSNCCGLAFGLVRNIGLERIVSIWLGIVEEKLLCTVNYELLISPKINTSLWVLYLMCKLKCHLFHRYSWIHGTRNVWRTLWRICGCLCIWDVHVGDDNSGVSLYGVSKPCPDLPQSCQCK